jgi:hypothetical protein
MPVIFARTKPPQYVQIGAVASGALAHGDAFTIPGSFGTNTAPFTFLGGTTSAGGAAGTIEATPAGVEVSDTVTNWNLGSTGPRGQKLGYDDATRRRVWTGTYGASTDVGAITYDTGSNIAPGETVYATYWHYLTGLNAFSTGQVKLIRSVSIDDLTDPNTQLYLSLQTGSLILLADPSGGGSGGTTVFGDASLMAQDAWRRVELIIEYPSAESVADGKATVRIHDGSSVPSNISFTFSGGQTNSTLNIYADATRSRRILFQGYFGNGNTQGTIRQDDHYVQRGNRRRVELCNNATYALSTVREIQPWTSWSGNVAGKINKGGLAAGSYYLHVVGDADTSLGSMAVTIQ